MSGLERKAAQKDPMSGLAEGWKECHTTDVKDEHEEDQMDVINYPSDVVSVEMEAKDRRHYVFVKEELEGHQMDRLSPASISGGANINDEQIGITDEGGGRISINPSNKALNMHKDRGFETILSQSFSATFVKEKPYDDIVLIFKESPLEYEKQEFHRHIFWNLIEKNIERKIKIQDIRTHYLNYLRKSVDLEIFKCLLCNDYESIHKENLKFHLILVHKSDMNHTIFKCKTCNLQKSRRDYIQKHMLLHELNGLSEDNRSYESEVKKMPPNNHLRKCDLCSFESSTFLELKNHKSSHRSSDSLRYICYLCPFEIHSKVKLKKHLLISHNIGTNSMDKLLKKWKCDNCDYTTDLKKSFDIHSISHKEPNEIEYFHCASCDFKTKHKEYLRNHFLKHKDPSEIVKKYMCEICSRRFRVRARLKIHMLTHKTLSELPEIQKCTDCDYQTKTKAALYTHMEVHRDPQYVCDLCGHQSRRKWNHEMHLMTHKKDKEAERKLKESRGPQAMDQDFSDNLKFNCFVCQFETMHRKIFSEHSKTHDNPEEVIKKRFVCEVCGFRGRHKTHLYTHSVIHKSIDEVEPLKCEKCDFLTKSFSSWAAHKQLHKEPKFIHTCEICGLKNRRKYDHEVHMMRHKSSTEVPMIKCDLCNYQTKFKAYLREHLKKRHGILTAKRTERSFTNKS